MKKQIELELPNGCTELSFGKDIEYRREHIENVHYLSAFGWGELDKCAEPDDNTLYAYSLVQVEVCAMVKPPKKGYFWKEGQTQDAARSFDLGVLWHMAKE